MGLFGAICGALGAIGGALIGALSGLALPALVCVAGVVGAVAAVVGALSNKEDEDPEELGERSLQAEESGLKMKDDETYAEYCDRIRDFEVDSNKKHSKADCLRRGIEIQGGLCGEKNPAVKPLIESIVKKGENLDPGFYTKEKIQAYVDSGCTKEIGDFLNGENLPLEKSNETLDNLVSIEKKLDPTISDADAIRNVMEQRR